MPLALIGVLALAALGVSQYVGRFDSDVWKRHNEEAVGNPRSRMVDDLLDEHLHVGMPQADVVALLGEPAFGEWPLQAYPIGYEPGWMKIDPWAVYIRYDANGRVANIRVGE